MKGVIIQRNAGKVVPASYLTLAVTAHHDAIGSVMADKRSDGTPELLTAVGYTSELNLAPDKLLTQIQGMLDAAKDKDVILFLGSSTTKNDDDLQPHILLTNESGDPQVACFLVGDFNNFAQAESAHPPEFFAATTFLRPMVKKLFTQCGNDLDKLFSELNDPVTAQNIRNSFGAKGIALFTGANGAVAGISQGMNAKEYPWGEVSEHFGYTEDTGSVVKNRLADMLGMKSKRTKAEGEQQKPQEEPAKPAPTEVPAEKPQAQPEPAKVPLPQGGTEIKFVLKACPSTLKGKNSVKNWYRNNSLDGTVPENFKSRPKVKCKVPDEPIRTLQDLPQTETKVPADAGTQKQVEKPQKSGGLAGMLGMRGKNAPKAEQKETPAAPQPEQKPAEGDPQPEPKREIQPLLSPQELKALREGFMATDIVRKHVDKSSNDVPDPKVVHDFEQKLPTFAEISGLPGLEATFFWEPEAFMLLIEEHPMAALVLMQNYRSAIFRHLQAEGKIPEKTEEPKKPSNLLERLKAHGKAA